MAKTPSPHNAKDEEALMTALWEKSIADDPYAFVMFVYPWGELGTPLEHVKGPRSWQKRKLLEIKAHIAKNNIHAINKTLFEMLQDATVSGRGIGKSAFVAWIIHWFISTRLGSTTIVSANTEMQLTSRTWPELNKWVTMAINSHWFEPTAMSLRPAEWFKQLLKNQLKIDTGYYYAQAQIWSEEKPDSYAGAHNPLGMMLIYDEASGIPEVIWRVSKGFFTEPTPNRFWFVFSNGRRNTGPFFECFHKNRANWKTTSIDARTVEDTDPQTYQEYIDKYGEDSDEVAIEVKGGFPRQGDKQFISNSLVDAAIARELVDDSFAALMMGVDIARFGNDSTVIRFRQGRNARIIPPVEMKGADNMVVANEVAHLIDKYNPDAVCIDAGNGTGVIDRLKERGYKIHEVWFGGASLKPEYLNRRTWLWAEMRDWLGGSALDDHAALADDLKGPIYKFASNSDKMRLETKEEMKDRGLASPDHGDALACTFDIKVPRRDTSASRHNSKRKNNTARDVDYPLFG